MLACQKDDKGIFYVSYKRHDGLARSITDMSLLLLNKRSRLRDKYSILIKLYEY